MAEVRIVLSRGFRAWKCVCGLEYTYESGVFPQKALREHQLSGCSGKTNRYLPGMVYRLKVPGASYIGNNYDIREWTRI